MFDSIDKNKMEERREPSKERRGDTRSEYDRDEARLIHSAAFRRLQSKTQVLGLGESDFYRTRLTHSMEVAQIGRGLVQYLKNSKQFSKYHNYLPDMALITSICLAHDIGHPPFGHGGEVALNYCMRNHGGFEGNGQTLRILGKIEKYTKDKGLNPTRRMLLGVLKYPASYNSLLNEKTYSTIKKYGEELKKPYWLFKAKSQKPPKGYYDVDQDIVDFIFEGFDDSDVRQFTSFKTIEGKHKETSFKSLDCSIMDLADDISYSLHDLEDALSLGMINRSQWEKHFESSILLFDELEINEDENKLSLKLSKAKRSKVKFNSITDKLFNSESYERKGAIGSLVHLMITNIFIEENGSGCKHPLLRFKVKLKEEIETLRQQIFNLVLHKVIKDENVQQLEFKGQKLIIELFQVLSEDPDRFLPKSTKKMWLDAEIEDISDEDLESVRLRIICDFIAGMTDDYATKFYEKFFTPNKGSIFDRL